MDAQRVTTASKDQLLKLLAPRDLTAHKERKLPFNTIVIPEPTTA